MRVYQLLISIRITSKVYCGFLLVLLSFSLALTDSIVPLSTLNQMTKVTRERRSSNATFTELLAVDINLSLIRNIHPIFYSQIARQFPNKFKITSHLHPTHHLNTCNSNSRSQRHGPSLPKHSFLQQLLCSINISLRHSS